MTHTTQETLTALEEIEECSKRLERAMDRYLEKEGNIRPPDFTDVQGEAEIGKQYECAACRANFTVWSLHKYTLPATRYNESAEGEYWPFQAYGRRTDRWICCTDHCREVLEMKGKIYYSHRRQEWEQLQQASQLLKLVRNWLKNRREV